METVQYLAIEGYTGNPAFSEIAVIPPNASLVWIGGQNSVSRSREIVGVGNLRLQAETVRDRITDALKTAGCDWNDVVRVHVSLVAGSDLRAAYEAFAPVFATRAQPPLVSGGFVTALAHPHFLLEVGVEAVQQNRT